MKLCALTQSYAPAGGGVRTVIHAQRAWCRTRGIEHLLIVPGAEDSVTRDGVLTTCTVASPFVPGSANYRLLLRSDKVLRLLRAGRPDVVEVHCAYNLPWTAFAYRRRRPGVLVSGIFNTDVPAAYVEAPLRRLGSPRIAATARELAERYMRALYNRCDVAIAISPLMRDRLREIGVHDVHLVPLGVDLEMFSPRQRDPAVRRRLGVGDGELLLIYAGRLDSEKRPDMVLDAFAGLPPETRAHLVLVGDGPLRQELEARGRALGRVHVLPYEQDRAELAGLLASADVYISGMAHETFGLSVVEAQACGLPVVGVRAGAMIDRVREGEGYLVAADSPSHMARVIAEAAPDELRRMGQRARQRVESEFSWDRTFTTLLEIYHARAGVRAADAG